MNKKITTSFVASFFLATSNLYSQPLSEITVVSATKSEQSIKDVTSNVEVITKEEIEEKHYSNVSEALNNIAGISFTNNGSFGSSTSMFVRGNDSKRVLVLIDGIRYNDITGTSGAPYEHLMMNNIEQIEVVKGAQSGIWGADASAGVINIITKRSQMGTHGSSLIERGSFNTKKYRVNLSHRNEQFYIQGSIFKVDTDGFSSFEAKRTSANYGKRGDELGLEKDGYENITGNIKLGFNFDDSNKIDISHTIIDAKNNFDSTSADTLNTSKTRDNFTGISFQNNNNFATTTINANRSTFDREYYTYNTNSTKYYDGEVNEYGIKTNIPYKNDSSFVILGADYKDFEHKNDINETYDNQALYLTNSNKFNNDNTIVTQSIRVDDYDKFDDKTTGKVGIKHYLTKELDFSANYGTAYNVPTLYNLYSQYGNKDINPETTKGFDTQIRYKNFTIGYFYTKVTDMIDYDFGTSKYGNLDGETRLKGYELTYKKEVLSNTLLNLNYTHLSAKDASNKNLARRAKRELNFGIDYYGLNKFHFNVNGSYVGTRYNSVDNAGAQTGRYTIWNSVINYTINKNLSTYMKLDNITNKYYQVVDGYATAERSVFVGLKATF